MSGSWRPQSMELPFWWRMYYVSSPDLPYHAEHDGEVDFLIPLCAILDRILSLKLNVAALYLRSHLASCLHQLIRGQRCRFLRMITVQVLVSLWSLGSSPVFLLSLWYWKFIRDLRSSIRLDSTMSSQYWHWYVECLSVLDEFKLTLIAPGLPFSLCWHHHCQRS